MTRARAVSLAVALETLGLGACRNRETPAPRFEESIRVNDLDGGAAQSEPSIAVDTQGRTLLAAWVDWSESVPRVRLARSTDGGASFAASRRIDSNPLHTHGQAEATLAFADGRFAFGWIGCRPDADSLENHACDVYATTSSDGGLSWAAPSAIAEGGSPRRDRPWIVAEGERFTIAWSEVGGQSAQGSSWRSASEREDGVFRSVASLDRRSALQPPSATDDGLEALLLDHSSRDAGGARTIALELRHVAGASTNGSMTWFVRPESALLPYSIGAFASRRDGEAWVAVPEGTGLDGDLLLSRRPAAQDSFAEVRGIRSGNATRVGLPWILPLRQETARFLVTWIEEEDGAWNVRARLLGPGTSLSRAADVSRSPFTFTEASRTRNIGDFLAATTSGDAFWVAWSDTRDGDADIWIARGKTP